MQDIKINDIVYWYNGYREFLIVTNIFDKENMIGGKVININDFRIKKLGKLALKYSLIKKDIHQTRKYKIYNIKNKIN